MRCIEIRRRNATRGIRDILGGLLLTGGYTVVFEAVHKQIVVVVVQFGLPSCSQVFLRWLLHVLVIRELSLPPCN